MTPLIRFMRRYNRALHEYSTRVTFVATALVAVAVVSCSAPTAEQALPAGPYFSADGVALHRLLGRLEALKPARIGEAAALTRVRTARCTEVWSRPSDPDLSTLLDGLECRNTSALPVAIAALREKADFVFSTPHGPDGHLIVTSDIAEDGTIDAHLQVPTAPGAGLWSLLVPAADDQPATLASQSALLHTRTRAVGGLAVADMVPPGSQGDRMFGLRNSLFAGALLDGRIELALYSPQPGQAIPQVALALGVSLPTAASKAMSGYVSYLESVWPVHRSPLRIGSATGACLADLNTAPDLAPCYVATDDALVVGWNAASLKTALARGNADLNRSKQGPRGGELTVHFDRIAAAEATLAESWGGLPATPQGGYPWNSLTATSTATHMGVEFLLRLQASSAEPGGGTP
jgi:hypothetical protein